MEASALKVGMRVKYLSRYGGRKVAKVVALPVEDIEGEVLVELIRDDSSCSTYIALDRIEEVLP